MSYEAEIFRRADGLFDWRLIADNGEQVAQSSQGYTEANDAREAFLTMALALATGANMRTGIA